MLRYMAHGPSDRASNQLQWRIPHNVANFSKLATMKIIPIIVLGFIIMFLLVVSLQNRTAKIWCNVNPAKFLG